MTKRSAAGAEPGNQVGELYSRPGFLVRRANQIAVSLFLEESAKFSITTTQYGTMVILRSAKGLDQIGVAKMLGIDRSTAALVVGKLETVGYVLRALDPRDKRRYTLRLTERGASVLQQMAIPAERARRRLLSLFSEDEQRIFLQLLERFVETFNDDARARLIAIDPSAT